LIAARKTGQLISRPFEGNRAMTFTLIGRCPRSGALGIGITSYSLAVSSKCPAVATHVGAITSQAFVNPTFKALGLRLLALGHPAAQTLDLLRGADPDFAFRQVAIVDRWGNAACHTGEKTRPWTGHRTGDGFVALGNVLKGEAVVDAMAEAYAKDAGLDLAERIMRALEAGRDAGGQHGLDGPLPERSAGILIHEQDEHPALDLRVDSHPDAVRELRRVVDEFRPYVPFYRQRWLTPSKAQPQDAFVKSLGEKPRR
jgi:uncharacterized Ntn-hydrolase superfamily protein